MWLVVPGNFTMLSRLWKLLFCLGFALLTCAAHGGDLKLLTCNVWYGFTIDAPGQPAEARHRTFRQWVKAQAPDIVALQELNGYTEEKLKADAASWGHEFSALLKTDGFPTGITSNAPITHVVRTLKGFHHGLLRAETHGYTVYVVHLHPSNWETRRKEIDTIMRGIDAMDPNARAKAIVMGDFNTFSAHDKAAYEESRLVPFFADRDATTGEKNLRDGKLDHAVTDALEKAGFVDVVAALRTSAAAPSGTFPTRLRAHEDHGDERRLDYLFLPETAASNCVSARIVNNATTQLLSDHLPVIATIREDD